MTEATDGYMENPAQHGTADLLLEQRLALTEARVAIAETHIKQLVTLMSELTNGLEILHCRTMEGPPAPAATRLRLVTLPESPGSQREP